MSGDLKLSEMLNEHWLAAIGDLIKSQPEASKYLGASRDAATIPERSLTFTSLNQLPPKDINVVIFGQDPYPRAESAVGIAFNDGAIHKWSDPLNPSLRNIIKNVLYGAGELGVDDAVDALRAKLAQKGVAQPPEWFKSTIASGVCWLNTSLTFSSKSTDILALHLKFWKPIVEGIIGALIDAKRELVSSGQSNAGLVFVLWGAPAQKLRKMVEKLNSSKKPQIALQFVEAPHPAANGTVFHTVKSFASVNAALETMGLPIVDWMPKGGAAPAEPETVKKPAKKAASKKVAATKEVEEDEEPVPAKKSAKKATAAKKAAKKDDTSSDESDYDEVAPKKKATAAKKATTKKRARKGEEDESDYNSPSEDDEAPPAAKRKRGRPAKN